MTNPEKLLDLTDREQCSELYKRIIKNRNMLPEAKGRAGMILFKMQNDIPLNNSEEKFFFELESFVARSN